MAEAIALSLFAAGYLAITMEHRIFVNKAAASLLLAVALWIVASFALPVAELRFFLAETSVDIFGLIIFLLTAMTLVEILVHYHLFDVLERWLRSRGWTTYHMSWALVMLTFVFSAILDNLTTTIVMIQIARRLFPKQELLAVGALLVIVANAGGAFSPIGDVTTLMLWFAGKFSASQIITQGFLPSIVMAAIPSYMILSHIHKKSRIPVDCDHDFHPSRSDRAIMLVTLGSFLLPLAASFVGLPPYMGLLAGLGLVWVFIDFAKRARPQNTHLQASIHSFLQKTDIESLQFFIGILLAVGALHALGILHWMTDALLGSAPSWTRLVTAFVGLGLGSAVVDNVPLTAAAISALEGVSPSLWTLLAITVGTGGSLLVIGSAAGVVAMGMIQGMTFMKYFKIAAYPSLLGFLGAVVVWAVQYKLFL
ncbi:MAG: sodium:proton antiporter NhaD [Candidatus Andersenbacteria bacterium]